MTKTATDMPADSQAQRYANDAALATHFGVAKATIWRWVRSNGFPQPVKLSAQITRWKWADVQAWEAAKQ